MLTIEVEGVVVLEVLAEEDRVEIRFNVISSISWGIIKRNVQVGNKIMPTLLKLMKVRSCYSWLQEKTQKAIVKCDFLTQDAILIWLEQRSDCSILMKGFRNLSNWEMT